MAKRKDPASLLPPPVQLGDREYLQLVTRKMLARLEKTIESEEVPSDPDGDGRHRAHERIFGQKVSLANVLVMLSDLLLRLGGGESSAPAESFPSSPEDLALIEGFCARERKQAPVLPTP